MTACGWVSFLVYFVSSALFGLKILKVFCNYMYTWNPQLSQKLSRGQIFWINCS